MRTYPMPGDVGLMRSASEYLKLDLAWHEDYWNATFYHTHYQCNHGRQSDAAVRVRREAIIQQFLDSGWAQIHVEEDEKLTSIFFERPRSKQRAHPSHCCASREEQIVN